MDHSAQVEDKHCFSTSVGGATQVKVAGIELGSPMELAGIELQIGDGRADGKRRWQGEVSKSNGLIAWFPARQAHIGGGALKRRVEARRTRPLLAEIATVAARSIASELARERIDRE